MAKTILIIEDDSVLRELLANRFTKEGFEVWQAENGELGMEKALEKHPDMIMLDIVMPRMDGMTLLKKLREDDWGKTAKVLILTNLTDSGSMIKAMEKHASEFIIKGDWKMDELVKKVKERL